MIKNILKNKSIYKVNYYGKEVKFYLPVGEDHIQRIIKETGNFYEIEMLRDILKLVPTGSTAIDVGANIGNHTLFFSSICELKTYSFEPSSEIRQILSENVKINNLNNLVSIHPFAVGESTGLGSVLVSDNRNLGMSRVVQGESAGEKVKIVAIDELKIKKVALLKIDVEGMEIDVLRGAKNTIAESRPIIFAELATAAEYNIVRDYLAKVKYVPAGKYNATPTIMFWPEESINKFLPTLMFRGDFE